MSCVDGSRFARTIRRHAANASRADQTGHQGKTIPFRIAVTVPDEIARREMKLEVRRGRIGGVEEMATRLFYFQETK